MGHGTAECYYAQLVCMEAKTRSELVSETPCRPHSLLYIFSGIGKVRLLRTAPRI